MKNSIYKQIPEDDLQTAATMLSACEQRSVKAERQFQAIKKARFMQKFIGEEFEGIISSVTKFGVFVLLRQYEVDGLIRAENLSKEKLEFDEENLVLVGKRSGMRFAIGDLLTIRVDAADPEAGQVDFGLAAIGKERSEMLDVMEDRKNRKGEKPPRRTRKSFGKENRSSSGSRSDRNDNKGRKGSRGSKNQNVERESKPLKSKPERIVPKSKKARALDQMEERVLDLLAEANSESETRGQKFDPEKHLQQALKKWKERNADSPPARISSSSSQRGFGRRSREDERSRSREDESREEKKPQKSESFFSRFKKKSEDGGNKKSSGKKGSKR